MIALFIRSIVGNLISLSLPPCSVDLYRVGCVLSIR